VRDRVAWAFIYGSTARGDDRMDSDVDLFVVGSVSDDELSPIVAGLQREIGRDVDAVTYSLARFRERRAAGNHFIGTTLSQPRIDVIGGPNDAI
jgi:predicted nucleotidyltransferase